MSSVEQRTRYRNNWQWVIVGSWLSGFVKLCPDTWYGDQWLNAFIILSFDLLMENWNWKEWFGLTGTLPSKQTGIFFNIVNMLWLDHGLAFWQSRSWESGSQSQSSVPVWNLGQNCNSQLFWGSLSQSHRGESLPLLGSDRENGRNGNTKHNSGTINFLPLPLWSSLSAARE